MSSTERELAHAKVVARAVHQGELDGDGTPVLDRLARTVELLDGFDVPLQCATWLHLVPRTADISPQEMAPLGVSRDVIALIDVLNPRPSEDEQAWLRRIGTNPDAALIELATRMVTSPGRTRLNLIEQRLSEAAGVWAAAVLHRAGVPRAS